MSTVTAPKGAGKGNSPRTNIAGPAVGRFFRQAKPNVAMTIAIHPVVKRAFLRQYRKSAYVSPAAVVQAVMVLYLTDPHRFALMDAGHYRPDQNSPARRARRRHALLIHELVTTDDPIRQRTVHDILVREPNPEDR